MPGQSIQLDHPTPDLWFNKAAFVRHPGGFGNAGRNIITAPGLANFDLSLVKSTTVKENVNVQFRAEAFNVFNHPNFSQPSGTVTSGSVGLISGTVAPPVSIYGSGQGAFVSGRVLVVTGKFTF